MSLSPAVELEWLVRVFGGFREFNVAFFQKPLNCPVDHHHRKSVFLIQYIPPHRKTDLSFYSLLVASSLIEEYWSISLDYAPVIPLVLLRTSTTILLGAFLLHTRSDPPPSIDNSIASLPTK